MKIKIFQKTIVAIAVLVSTVLSAQTPAENYVKTTAYQTAVQEGQQNQVLESDKIESVNYFDGLGRAKQSIAVKAGGQKQNTNIFDWTDDWKIGTGSTPLFNHAGRTVDNKREFGTNPFGEQSLLWRCGNNENVQTNAGWNSDHFTIDKSIGYMYTVWIKRTGSVSGTAYHGIWDVNFVNGTSNGNPYFLYEKLPNANTWYLLVGMIYPHDYTGGNPQVSGIYDIDGNKVANGTDFKWKSTTSSIRIRDFYYDGTATNSYAYYWNPRISIFDGDLQPISQLIAQSKPKDIITHYQYDDYGRQAKEYLPYASEQTQNGAIYTDPLAELNTFYNTPKYQNTTNPYSETIFDESPLNRPLKQAAPGLNWAASNTEDDHTIKIDRGLNNNTDAIVYFRVNLSNENIEAPSLVKVGNYRENELYVNITKDENWESSDTKNHTTEEYIDKLGRIVLKRTFNTNVPHDTYYVYDVYGNLTYVIPPKVTINDVSTTELAELCYQYKYDSRNRLVEKKIPGKGWEYIVYNKLDQPVLTQDANQRAKKEWLFTKYDAFGRVAYTGLHRTNDATSRITMQGLASNTNTYEQYVVKTTPSDIAGTTIYYTNTAIPIGIAAIYTINYYDNYTFDRDGMDKPAIVDGISTSNNVKGLATGTKVRVLGTDKWITTVSAYDAKGRVIWTGNRNDYLNTTDIEEMVLDFTGKPKTVKTTHTKGSNAALVTTNTFAYDHMGRLLVQKQKIDNFTEEMIAHNTYDNLGQLESRKVGNAEQAPLQTIDYKYNVRGWLTDINDVNSIGDDLFTFRINYDNPTISGSKALYNGNISETHWKTANDHALRNYRYGYDALNRITYANSDDGRFSLFNVNYDKMGNIQGFVRNGATNASGTSFGIMDQLTYTYDSNSGNKLLRVQDFSGVNEGFKDGTNTNNDFVYDDNGNLITDRNKEIFSISYNHLNLPEKITFNKNGTKYIQYWYDASGNKLKKFTLSDPRDGGITTEYDGGYIYENYKLKFFNHSEGYVEPVYITPKSLGFGGEPSIGYFDYIYQYKDHLGNIRLSYSDKDNDGHIDVLRNNTDVDGDSDNAHEILQEKNYYPFGLQHKGYNNTITGRKHNYGFGGKEEQNELGLEWIDVTARNYDPALGRWMNIDPLAELMRRHSPYNYAFNNPIVFTDPDGMAPFTELFNLKGKKIGEDENGNDGNVSIITNEDDAKRIKKNTKKGQLASEEDVNSGVKTTKTVLGEALDVLQRTEDNGGFKEETSVVDTEGNVTRGKAGNEAKKGDKAAKGALPTVAGDNNTSIHSHPTGTKVNEDGSVVSSSALEASTKDSETFKKFNQNVIVGPLGYASGQIQPDGNVLVSQPGNGVVIFNRESKPLVALKKKAVKKIIKK